MPLDYIPAPSAYISYAEPKQINFSRGILGDTSGRGILVCTSVRGILVSEATTTSLSGNAELDFDAQVFNAKAVWGPISGRLIPSTKKTLSEVMSQNIADLSRDEYEQLRYLIEYIATHPESKARVFELTGFNDNDLAFAEKYFRKYNSRKMFAKLVEFALKTSSNGKVSKQIGGITQFIFETGQINGQEVQNEFKFKLLRGLPELLIPIWEQAAADCPTGAGICTPENKAFLDLNADNQVNDLDIQAAYSSLDWLNSQIQ